MNNQQKMPTLIAVFHGVYELLSEDQVHYSHEKAAIFARLFSERIFQVSEMISETGEKS